MTIGAFCIIENENKEFLLCHRCDRDLWNLPGGRVEEGESPWATAIREVKEEVLLDVTIDKLIGCYYKKETNDLVFMFLAKADKNQKPQLSDEADIINFFNIDTVPNNTAPKQLERLKLFYSQNKDSVVLLEQ